MNVAPMTRRLMLASLALPALQGCSAPLPPMAASTSAPEAEALLAASAAAHGLDALAALGDVAVSYAGAWHGLVARLQPALVDAGHRGGSEERLLLRADLAAQVHAGPAGRKQVLRQTVPHVQGRVTVWFDGLEALTAEPREAAALVADGYGLFLLGPMLLERRWRADKAVVMTLAGAETISLAGQDVACDRLRLRATPGLGFSEADELALFIGCADRLMRRVRFTLNGLESTRGAVAEVDTTGHVARHGVLWPTQFQERLLRPLPLAVHEWRLTGLDVDRGLVPGDLAGPDWSGKAAAPAAALA